MKIRKGQNKDERLILTGMILNDQVCRKIAVKWQPDLFESKWSNLISRWCVDHFKLYDESPKRSIESTFDKWSLKHSESSVVNLVDKFLSGLSEEYEQTDQPINADYILDRAGQYFDRVKLYRLSETIQENLIVGQVQQASDLVKIYESVNIGTGAVVDLFHDEEIIKTAIEQDQDDLFRYPGALGQFFQHQLGRECFVSFIGPEKRGKSFFLLDMAFRSALQRNRTVLFEAGDMTQRQVVKRFCTRVAGQPYYARDIKIPQTITPPPKPDKPKRGEAPKPKPTAIVKRAVRRFREGLSISKVLANRQQFVLKKLRSKNSYFRLSCHPNSTLHVDAIESTLRTWEVDGWIPDVIVIDYADILDMSYPGLDRRDQIDRTWRYLRRISQVFHCLVVTATQSDAVSYDAETIKAKHFSEDKRKMAHVTGFIGINSTPQEEDKGLARLNWVLRREGASESLRCVHVAGCRDIANPAMVSCY